MTNNLTQPISKKLLFSLLIIAIGVEIVLYLSRYSYLASTVYDVIMVSSFFIGLKIYQRLSTDHPKTKRQLWLQFTGAFLIFFVGSTLINIFSSFAFQDFSSGYDQFVEDYTEMPIYEDEVIEPIWALIDEIDMVGYDLFTDTLAGLEEVWRLAYMILILIIFKKIFPRRWEKGSRDIFIMIALFVTSILFGIDHTLSSENSWQYRIGAIVTFANMGLIFGLILLWTRNLWITVVVHSVYDITATLSWYYFQFTVEVFALIVLLVHVILFSLEKRQRNLVVEEPEKIAN
jgi:membrane protease YdiL (CAAX protease family)